MGPRGGRRGSSASEGKLWRTAVRLHCMAEGLGGRGRQNRAFISKQNRAVANVSALFVTL